MVVLGNEVKITLGLGGKRVGLSSSSSDIDDDRRSPIDYDVDEAAHPGTLSFVVDRIHPGHVSNNIQYTPFPRHAGRG